MNMSLNKKDKIINSFFQKNSQNYLKKIFIIVMKNLSDII